LSGRCYLSKFVNCAKCQEKRKKENEGGEGVKRKKTKRGRGVDASKPVFEKRGGGD